MARVLIAEDEPALREYLRRALKRRGDDVTVVADGQAALFALGQAEFDVLLADIMMPVLDGIQLALKATHDHPNVRVLLMTGYTSEEGRARSLGDLIERILFKPFSMKELYDAIDAALAAPAREPAPDRTG